ncbi:MAG: PilZ domain-containing protein [Chthoniobacterales bacterium]|nr:PilZ domain-containing protein [Chthoniobacterales bacterium]
MSAVGPSGKSEGVIELPVEYSHCNVFFFDYLNNIRGGGTFISTEKPLPIGTDFLFQIKLPRLEAPLFLRGRVQWVVCPEEAGPGQSPGMGIGFLFDSEADRERFRMTVEKTMIEEFGPELVQKILSFLDSNSKEE